MFKKIGRTQHTQLTLPISALNIFTEHHMYYKKTGQEISGQCNIIYYLHSKCVANAKHT